MELRALACRWTRTTSKLPRLTSWRGEARLPGPVSTSSYRCYTLCLPHLHEIQMHQTRCREFESDNRRCYGDNSLGPFREARFVSRGTRGLGVLQAQSCRAIWG